MAISSSYSLVESTADLVFCPWQDRRILSSQFSKRRRNALGERKVHSVPVRYNATGRGTSRLILERLSMIHVYADDQTAQRYKANRHLSNQMSILFQLSYRKPSDPDES